MSWLLANTIAATVLSMLVVLIARFCKPAPAVMHGLWLLVVLKLVTPPLFEVPLDFSWLPSMTGSNHAEPTAAAPGRTVPPEAAAMTMPVAPPLAWLPQPTEPRATESLASGSPSTGSPWPSTGSPWPPTGSLSKETPPNPAKATPATTFPWLWAWLGTSSLLLLATARSTLRIHKIKRALSPVPTDMRLEVRELAERIGVVVPELCDDPNAVAPYIWTVGRTRLVMPVGLLQTCSKKGRSAVIAHELAHLRRKDHWIARGELALLTLLWWHPLFWFARSRMRLWAELACDAIAVTTVPNANLDYATLLVDAAALPLSTQPGVAVLASRPAARAAFERRLKMILNENLPHSASRAWCVPFAALTLGLFAVPVAAQEQEPEPVRVEIRVNGKKVKNLSDAQREALLEVLLNEKKPAKQELPRIRVRRPEPVTQQPKQKAGKTKIERRIARTKSVEGMADLQGALKQGLAEARREIKNDPDLMELGITDEVLDMIDGLANGEGIESSLDGVVKAAMKGAGKMVLKEISDDEDLRRLGIDKGIAKLVTGLLENEGNQKILGQLARTALGSVIEEAKAEIRDDKDLQELGIADDVEDLIDSIISGNGDFESNLNMVIEKAMKGAMAEVEREIHGATKGTPKTERRVRIKPRKKDAVENRRQRETIR
tara:strand:- start:55795 stop:57780 length:1986 start_codon:yes stop_codon:yes gene_type:complete